MQVTLSIVSFLLFYGDFLSMFLVNLILLTAAELIALDTKVLSSSKGVALQRNSFVYLQYCKKPFQYCHTREMRGWFIILIVKYTHSVVRQLIWKKKTGKVGVFPQGNAVNISWGSESPFTLSF